MRRISQLAILASAIPALAADAPRPRGVGPELAKHYKSQDSFSCIFNPSIKISTSRINDNYCDCPDGSDEPGTSALDANTTLALPGFYCKNKGHIPAHLPLTNVNDGVCDYDVCCDGSDEYEGVGGIKCPDKCKDIGKEWRKKDEARQKSMTSALKKRLEYVTQAGRLRKEVEDKVKDLEVQIQGSQIKLKDMEAKLADEERLANGRVVKGPGKAGRTGVLAGLAKTRIEELTKGLAQIQSQRDHAQSRLDELEKLLTTFQQEYNPNFNDEGVKRAVRAWEDYAARDKGQVENDISDDDITEMLKPDSETGIIKWDEWERPEEKDEIDMLYDFEAYLPPTLRNWIDGKLRAVRLFLIENGILSRPDESSAGEDPAVVKARSEVDSARQTLNTQENDLTSNKDDLAKDYGPDEVFRALRGKCIQTDSGEYTYELCFLGEARQRSRKGGGDTNMGNFASLGSITVDEEVPADGKGLGSGTRVTMRHDNGQHCWNGPNRSTTVVLACAEEDEIWKIIEEEKCVYRMEVGTPAVCEPRKTAKKVEKDEL